MNAPFIIIFIVLSLLKQSFCLTNCQTKLNFVKLFSKGDNENDICENCIILSGERVVPSQDFNYWCYKSYKAYSAYLGCNEASLNDFYNKIVVFECLSMDCNKTEFSCLENFEKTCIADLAQGCVPSNVTQPTTTTTTEASTTATLTTLSTECSSVSTTQSTTIKELETTSTISTTLSSTSESSSVTSTTENSTTASTAVPINCKQGYCLPGECFFQNYCYFIVTLSEEVLNATIALQACAENGSLARGVAVSSNDENIFVKTLVQQYGFDDLILTAGIKSAWNGWFRRVNHSLLQLPDACSSSQENVLLFLKLSYKNEISWECLPEGSVSITKVICEREDVWSTVLPELRESCLAKYKEQQCQGVFCCASDRDNRIWFQCGEPRIAISKMPCLDDFKRFAIWECLNGSFITDTPDTRNCRCQTGLGCSQEFNGIMYQACPGKYAYGECSNLNEGYQRWLCLGNNTFENAEPSQELCCGDKAPFKRQDPFLNIWVACPNTTVTRYAECFDGNGNVSWSCGPTGFLTPTPDYSQCSECPTVCEAVDNYGVSWRSCDYSACQSSWIDSVQNMINKGDNAITIMNAIHQHLDSENFENELKNVINITDLCIDLFVNQNIGNGSISSFENFTNSYIYVLDDFMKNSSLWSQIKETDRVQFMKRTIAMTEKLAYSLKTVAGTDDIVGYNKSFSTKNSTNNVDLWIGYSKNLSEFNFGRELTNYNCSVKVLGLNEMPSIKTLCAAVAIIIPNVIASVAFPTSNYASKIINSALLSMTVSDMSLNLPVEKENIAMEVTFRHVTRARQPSRKTINRRLHDGENPSPIIGNGQCYYYDTNTNSEPTWNISGCEVFSSSAEQTVCKCWHLSSFSVLVDIHDYEADPTLETFSIVCSIFSIIALIFTLIILKTLKSKKPDIDKDRSLIGINRCICLLVSHAIIATILDKKFFNIPDDACSIIAGVLHYALMAAFSWMSIEAYHLYHLIVLVFTRERSCRSHYFIIGYIFPVIPIVLTELASQVMQTRAYGRDEVCWLETKFIWSFDGPVFFLTSINLLVILVAMRAAITKRDNSSFKAWWVWCKGLVSLCTLLGITWLIALFYIESDLPIIFDYVFILFNGLQGVYIFIFQCILNNQVRSALMKLWFRKYRKDESSFSRKATVISGDFSAKTGTSSLESSHGVKVIRSASDVPGSLTLKPKSLSRDLSTNSNLISYDDTLRQFRNRIISNSINCKEQNRK